MAEEPQTPEREYTQRVLSGIQPTGELHLGNYFGAIRNWVDLQESANECFYCVVDYHAITADHDASTLGKKTIDMAKDLLACGVDPERSTLFVQSQVPEHAELSWILASVASYGNLTRMTQFKDKGERQEFVSVGLFTYPVLQAADILIYQATAVPVGADQVQHLEFARGIARRFNTEYGAMFPEPEPLLTEGARIMSPAEPTNKMSKSAGEKHYIPIFGDEPRMRNQIKRAVTDSGGEGGGLSPGVENLLTILRASGANELYEEMKASAEAGEKKYGDLKAATADHMMRTLAPLRERRAQFTTKTVKEILKNGAESARAVARPVLREARKRIGLARL